MNKVTVSPLITAIRNVESSAEFQRMLQALKRQEKAEKRMRQIDNRRNSCGGDLNALYASTKRRLRSIEARTERF